MATKRAIEQSVLNTFMKFRKQIPNLTRLTFEVSEFLEGNIRVHGFYHIGKGCYSYDSVDDLYASLSKYEILFRKV